MSPVGFEPTIPAGEGLQTDALDGAATGTGNTVVLQDRLRNSLSCDKTISHAHMHTINCPKPSKEKVEKKKTVVWLVRARLQTPTPPPASLRVKY